MSAYSSDAYQRLRVKVLARDGWQCQWPGCGVILRTGKHHPRSAVVDHKVPHQGSKALLMDERNMWSLCKAHHDSAKQLEEGATHNRHANAKAASRQYRTDQRGYSLQIGVDGWPVDSGHIFNSGPRKIWGYSIPHGIEPSAIPVMVVCGPPASGKSTYVQRHARQGDIIIDFDLIRQKVGGSMWDNNPIINARAFKYRGKMLHGLQGQHRGTAWLIVTAPTPDERATWINALGAKASIVIMDTPKDECIARINADPSRQEASHDMIEAVHAWQGNLGEAQ